MVHDSAWTAWQREHSEALGHLQDTQREYHRTVAARALAPSADTVHDRAQRERQLLDALNEARLRLDRIRQRQPEV